VNFYLKITGLKTGYRTPPSEISDLLDANPTPLVALAPTYDKLLLLYRPNLPGIEELAQKELRLAGLRINPKTNGSSRSGYVYKIEKTEGDHTAPILGIPKNARIGNVSWSPDGHHIAFTITKSNGIQLWTADLSSMKAQQLTKAVLNDVIGARPYRWLSDSSTIIYKAILEDRGLPPEESQVPLGPVIQSNDGKTSALRTYQDLLKNEFDESLFTYYCASQLHSISVNGASKKIGKPGIINSIVSSPNGEFLLVVIVNQPYSYAVPFDKFPLSVEIWNKDGELVKTVAEIPVADNVPTGFGAVRKGARSFVWRNDAAATLYWVEALDEGDPKLEVPFRDQVYSWKAPFGGSPQKSFQTELRYSGITWGNNKIASVIQWEWKDRRVITSVFSPDRPEKKMQHLFDRSWEDSYNDPGMFETTVNQYGRHVLLTADDGNSLFLMGEGASPEGKFPFIDKLNFQTSEHQRIWQCEAPYFETPIALLNPESMQVLTKLEGAKVVPNYIIRDTMTGHVKKLTDFPHPYEHLKDVEHQLLRYKRRDGVELTAKLYLPLHYNIQTQGPLPVLMWAYPREYRNAESAGQLKDSPYRFPSIHTHSPLYLLTQGYAVLEDFGMPIVGEGEEQPNETFVDQISMNAKAAIDKLVEMGVADPKRIAVGGHSYGAFMTANLLCHTNFFAAGIARSGAYNRTLTPFGFQSEERTFWEATKTYMDMSPFTHVNKIKTALLLIHGEADNNSGTYPMQSERLFNAIKGHGGEVRLVMLPHESHSYQSEESVKHMLWEMVTWLDKHLKAPE